jgi:hypothetical protein
MHFCQTLMDLIWTGYPSPYLVQKKVSVIVHVLIKLIQLTVDSSENGTA